MEGIPGQRNIEGGRTPEYWVARPERPLSKEAIGFQVTVARNIANRLNKPLSQVADSYTTVFHPYIWAETPDYLDIDRMNDEKIADAIHAKEAAHAAHEPPVEYRGICRVGCFSYFVHASEARAGRVDIHFDNKEQDATGPLVREKMERRIAELKEVFSDIRREYSTAAFVRGNSWLYNLEAYRRLFPESYTENAAVDATDGPLVTGRGWGQFYDDKLDLKRELAERFLARIHGIEEVTPDAVRQALPYQSLTVTAPIEDFYKKYGIT